MANMTALLQTWYCELKRPLQVGFAAAVLTAVIVLFLPNYYSSQVRILPSSTAGPGNLSQLAATAAAFGVNVGVQDSGEANYVDILKSRWLREQLLSIEFQFHQRSWRFGADRPHRETLYAYLEEKNLDSAVEAINDMIAVTRDLKSKVVTISVETRSPELSQKVAQRTTNLLEKFIQEKGRTRGGFKAAFAEARLREARQELAEAENDFRSFLYGNRNYLSSTDPTVRLQGSRLESELQLRRQLVTTLAMNREQALMEEKNDVPILNILDEGNLPIEKSWPIRTIFVLASFLLGAAIKAVWTHRRWINERMVAE